MKNSKQITEKMGIHKEWYKEAKTTTIKTLPKFIKKLSGYHHDYGTICHAIAAASLAAGHAIDHSKHGGITGFQASCVMWEYIQKWMQMENKPLRLVEYENMLYPQYRYRFCTISKETWAWLQKEAKEKLKHNSKQDKQVKAHSDVVAYWQSIVDGQVPFGYTIED